MHFPMIFRRAVVRSLVAASLVVLAACGGSATSDKNAAVKTIDERFPIKVGDHTVRMQLAVTAGEMEKGLMFVRSMGKDEGMLFIYETPRQMNFWMRNTELPLDIGFFDASGELREIYPLYPHDERTVASNGRSLKYALEMNQGWYRETGVKPGAKIDLAALEAALKARGFKPQSAGAR